jgi:hypothetical protein
MFEDVEKVKTSLHGRVWSEFKNIPLLYEILCTMCQRARGVLCAKELPFGGNKSDDGSTKSENVCSMIQNGVSTARSFGFSNHLKLLLELDNDHDTLFDAHMHGVQKEQDKMEFINLINRQIQGNFGEIRKRFASNSDFNNKDLYTISAIFLETLAQANKSGNKKRKVEKNAKEMGTILNVYILPKLEQTLATLDRKNLKENDFFLSWCTRVAQVALFKYEKDRTLFERDCINTVHTLMFKVGGSLKYCKPQERSKKYSESLKENNVTKENFENIYFNLKGSEIFGDSFGYKNLGFCRYLIMYKRSLATVNFWDHPIDFFRGILPENQRRLCNVKDNTQQLFGNSIGYMIQTAIIQSHTYPESVEQQA